MKTLPYWMLALLIPVGCDGGEEKDDTGPADADTDTDSDSDTDSDTDSDADADPVVTITSPSNGASIQGSTIDLSYTVTNFVLDPNSIGGTNVLGSGHAHIYDNGVYVDATASNTYSLTGLVGGPHTLEVRLANNDHSEPTDGDGAFISGIVTVELISPSIQILSPAPNEVLNASSVAASIQIGDFVIDPIGSANLEGHGHYHLYVDGDYVNYDTNAVTAMFSALTPGTHTLKVQLVGNDHLELNTEGTCGVDNLTCAEVSVEVAADAPYLRVEPIANGWTSGTVPVELVVDNFTLSQDIGGANVADEGHVHVYLDGAYIYATADSLSYLTNVAPGDHVVEVRMANNDHSETGVIDWIRINVAADRKDVVITSPPNGETLGDTFTILSSVENFTLSDDYVNGGAAVDGVGHYHIMVDGVYYNLGYTGSDTISGLTVGTHTIGLELVGNDHASLTPIVMDTVTVNIQ